MIITAIKERGEYLVHRIEVRDRTGTKISSTCSEMIYDPCDIVLVNNAAFVQDSPVVTGDYLYNWLIPSTATYGRYRTVVSTTTSTIVTKKEDYFYVMPWKLEDDIRCITGIKDTKSIDDDDLGHLSWLAYTEALRDVYIHHYRETPNGNPDTGTGFDGSNTSFQTKFYPIADINGDGTVSGNASCATDVDIWWIDNVGHYNRGLVTVTEYHNGELTITKTDGTAIPADNEGVFIDYWSSWGSYNENLFHDAVAFLAAHYVVGLRMTEVKHVTLADLASNMPIITLNERRFYNAYRNKIKKICKPRVDGV